MVFLLVGLHVAFLVPRGERAYQSAFILAGGLLGGLLDSGLQALDLLRYPTSQDAGPDLLAPGWIAALWLLFATLPAHSLAWLRQRPRLAVLLGAVGGPLSFLAGSYQGVIEVGARPLLSWIILALEYALVVPLMMHWSRPLKSRLRSKET